LWASRARKSSLSVAILLSMRGALIFSSVGRKAVPLD